MEPNEVTWPKITYDLNLFHLKADAVAGWLISGLYQGLASCGHTGDTFFSCLLIQRLIL